MGVQECIDEYCELAETVFTQDKRRGIGFLKWARPAFGKGRFDEAKLEAVIKKVVRERLGSEHATLHDPDDNACKVYVYHKLYIMLG
jgi:hypothetical protein